MSVLFRALPLLCVGFILRLALLLVAQMAEGILNLVFSSTPSRRRGIVPSGKPTEGWGSFFSRSPRKHFLKSHWPESGCMPTPEPITMARWWILSGLSTSGLPLGAGCIQLLEKGGTARGWVVPSRQNVGAVAGKGRRGTLGRQPVYVYYINIIIIVIKAKLEAVQI